MFRHRLIVNAMLRHLHFAIVVFLFASLAPMPLSMLATIAHVMPVDTMADVFVFWIKGGYGFVPMLAFFIYLIADGLQWNCR